MSFHFSLTCIAADEKSVVFLIFVLLNMQCLFWEGGLILRLSSLLLVFSNFMMMCLNELSFLIMLLEFADLMDLWVYNSSNVGLVSLSIFLSFWGFNYVHVILFGIVPHVTEDCSFFSLFLSIWLASITITNLFIY